MTHIFLLVGAPAVGKSSTARWLAVRFPKSIHIPVDTVREMVVSGVMHPGDVWGEDLIEQLAAARESVIQMAMTYNRAGFVVVIDDFWDPNSQLAEYQSLFAAPHVYKVLLYPSLSAAIDRNLKRSGPGVTSTYIDGGIRSVYANLETAAAVLEQQGWFVLDTTELSVEASVARILEEAAIN